jgi:hypothetical protein
MRPFCHKGSGSLTFGLFPLFKIFLDWRDAADGITFIRPTFHVSRYAEYSHLSWARWWRL